MDDSGDQDMYVSQLKEVFDSCDAGGLGMLNREELQDLCTKLQLDEQADDLLQHLVGNSTQKLIDFDTFKEGFVMVLSSAVDLDGIDHIEEDNISLGSINEVSLADEVEVSPKYVKAGKKYGRRSRPDFDLSYTADFSDIDTDLSSHITGIDTSRQDRTEKETSLSGGKGKALGKSSKSLSFADDISESLDGEFEVDNVLSASRRDIPMIVHETFEAEGQMNASMSLMEAAPTEAEQVQAIWDEVGVGSDGYLDIDDLSTVCQHIGMEDMDEEELKNLFNKLDVDQDDRVGFQEFLEGLFRHEGPRPPTTPLPSALSTAQKAKLRMSMMGSAMDDPLYRTATPSMIGGTQLLTMLDSNLTGYANPDDIAEQLAAQGIQNPMEVLENLDINTETGKVNLQDLSAALEHVLMTTGDSNGVYQAALTTYQSELKHLKNQLDALTDERDKLKGDIYEANQRNALLVKEVDESHASILKTNEAKLQAAEKKFQEKVTAMQSELEKERMLMAAQATKQSQRLEEQINQMKSGDAGLRERLLETQKEITRLEKELGEAAEKLNDDQKTIQKQQRDLDGFQELEERLAELESNRETVSKQQEEFFEQSLKEYQEHVRVLQDQLDEMTQENELLKHQSSERKIRRRGSKAFGSNKPNRVGSVLSDYTKPHVSKKSSGNSSSENESELEELDPKSKRRLPLAVRSGGDGNSNEEEDIKKAEAEKAKLEAEIASLKEQHTKELTDTKTNYERECKDIEFRYKMEITELEDNFDQQKDDMKEEFVKEQQQLIDEIERRFGEEKLEMAEHFAKEKQELEEFFTKEKTDLRDQMEADYNQEMDNRITEVEQKLLDEKAHIEKELSEEKSSLSEDMIRERAAGEMRLKKMQAQWEHEKAELERKYQDKVDELESLFVDGEVGLKGQLRRDFDELLSNQRAEIEQNFYQEKLSLIESFEQEKEAHLEKLEMEKAEFLKASKGDKTSILEKSKQEKSEMLKKHKKEKLELVEIHKKKIMDVEDRREQERSQLEEKVQRERHKFKQEREKLETRFKEEVNELETSLAVNKEELEKSIQEDVEDKVRIDMRSTIRECDQLKRTVSKLEDQLSLANEKLEGHHVSSQIHEAQLMLVTDEKEKLSTDLADIKKQLLESQMQLSIQETQHMREIQRVKDKQSEASMKELQRLREDVLRKDAQKKDTENLLAERTQEIGRIVKSSKEEWKDEVKRLAEIKAEQERKLKKMRATLDEYVKKLKDQLTRSTRSDIMVKELYMENCKLHTALQITEERQKNAERTCHNLTEKNQVYLRLIRKVSPAVI